MQLGVRRIASRQLCTLQRNFKPPLAGLMGSCLVFVSGVGSTEGFIVPREVPLVPHQLDPSTALVSVTVLVMSHLQNRRISGRRIWYFCSSETDSGSALHTSSASCIS